jgi:hypothetical protein
MALRLLFVVLVTGCLSTPARPTSDARPADGAGDTGSDTTTFTMRHWQKPAYTPALDVIAPSLAYNGDRQEVVLYGGETIAGVATEDSMYRLATPTGWAIVCDPCSPGSRAGASLAWDPVRHVIVLVGGWAVTDVLADSYFYEWDGQTWTQTSIQLPQARSGVQMVFDPMRGKLVVIGGIDESKTAYNDAFTYDGVSLDPLPSIAGYDVNNGGNTATYDVDNSRILLAPGNGFSTATGGDEVLALGSTANAWSTVCTSCGASRRMPVIIYDPVLHRLIMVGGEDTNGMLPSGTWELATDQWMQVTGMPPGRLFPAITYDASRETIVMYGGNGRANCPGGNNNCNETWEMVPN